MLFNPQMVQSDDWQEDSSVAPDLEEQDSTAFEFSAVTACPLQSSPGNYLP